MFSLINLCILSLFIDVLIEERMRNSVSDRSLYIESEEEEEEEVNEEEGDTKARPDDEASDVSDDDSSSAGSPRRSRPSSYNTTWPQSYR